MFRHPYFLPLRLALTPLTFLVWLSALPLFGRLLQVWAVIVLIPLLVLLKVGTAFAISAGDLHESCAPERTDIDGHYSFGFCSGYVTAIAERPDGFCIPSEIYVEKLVSQVLPLLSAMPDRHAALVLRDALRVFYPCEAGDR
jgi:hypothetical protein